MTMMPIYPQETAWSCGPAVLRSCIAYYTAQELSEQKLLQESLTTRLFGTHPTAMKKLLEKYTDASYSIDYPVECSILQHLVENTPEPIIVLYMIEKALNPQRAKKCTGRGLHYGIITSWHEGSIRLLNPFGWYEEYTEHELMKRVFLDTSPYLGYEEKALLFTKLLAPCTILYKHPL